MAHIKLHFQNRILLVFVYLTISLKSISQVNNWTVNIDLSKNGFLDNEKIFNRKDTLKFRIKGNQNDEYKVFNFSEKDEEVESIRVPIVFTKSNRKQILIWNDTKERLTKNEYDYIGILDRNTFEVDINGKRGIIDSTEKILVPINYARIIDEDPRDFIRRENYEYDKYANHEHQLFRCELPVLGGSGWDCISRDGKMFFHDKFIGVDNYFVKNKTIYTVYHLNDKIGIGKLWEKPTIFISGTSSFDTVPFLNNPLLAIIGLGSYGQKIYNFQTPQPTPITDIIIRMRPFSSDYNKISTQNTTYLVDKNLKIIVPKENKYYDIINDLSNNISPKRFINDQELNNQGLGVQELLDNQIKNDSILLCSKLKKVENGREFESYGFYKLGIGEIIDCKYQRVERIDKRLVIVTKFNNNAANILDLETRSEIFDNDFDSIYLEGENGVPHFKCNYEGKTTIYKLDDL